MYKKHSAYGTIVHAFEFNSEVYKWTIEVGQSGKLETLQQIAPDAEYVINWSVFDRNTGKDGYGRIQNGSVIKQGSSRDFPTVSFVDGKFKKGEYSVASPGFATWRILVQNSIANVSYVVVGNANVKDARSAVGQLKNGNIVFITVEGDDAKKRGMTAKELANFCVSLGCEFACDCDGGGSTACRTKDGYKYNQGRAIAGAMVLRKKSILEMVTPKVGCGYVWGSQGEILTKELLSTLVKRFGRSNYYFADYNVEKWLGMQVFDCSGLMVWAANKLGILSGDYTAAGLYNLCDKVITPAASDLCFNAGLTHVGIYMGNGKYLHAKSSRYGVVITGQETFTKFGRLKGGTNMSWDAKNKEFVKKFQQATGILADGLAGAQTTAKLDELLKSKSGDAQTVKDAWAKFLQAVK